MRGSGLQQVDQGRGRNPVTRAPEVDDPAQLQLLRTLEDFRGGCEVHVAVAVRFPRVAVTSTRAARELSGQGLGCKASAGATVVRWLPRLNGL